MTSPADQQPHGFGILLDGDCNEIESWLTTNTPPGRWPIDTLIPVHHKQRGSGSATWTTYVFGLQAEVASGGAEPGTDAGPPGAGLAAEVAAAIDTGPGSPVRRVDVIRLQPGLDMFYPKIGGPSRAKGMLQTIEYVTSRPEARDDYYTTQYEFSGPAMRRLHEADRCGRFIGFELPEAPYRADGIPEHDVIHLIGFRFRQGLKSIGRFGAAFDDAARAAGRTESGKEIISNWSTQRTKDDTRVRQLWPQSITPSS